MIGGIKRWFIHSMIVRRRPNVDWMTQSDERVLESLYQSEMALSPKVIAYNSGYNREYISQRLNPLLDSELVDRVDKGMYEITDRGRAYLEGDLDADVLERN